MVDAIYMVALFESIASKQASMNDLVNHRGQAFSLVAWTMQNKQTSGLTHESKYISSQARKSETTA